MESFDKANLMKKSSYHIKYHITYEISENSQSYDIFYTENALCRKSCAYKTSNRSFGDGKHK